jgi:hypothetical protein
LVGTQVSLANESLAWALLGNVTLDNPRLTRHFITVSVTRAGHWFHLARYHDWDYEKRGPLALSEFLHLPKGQIFPIRYDISSCCAGDPEALSGTIEESPKGSLGAN